MTAVLKGPGILDTSDHDSSFPGYIGDGVTAVQKGPGKLDTSGHDSSSPGYYRMEVTAF